MKKVVFFVTSINSGGIENYLLRFLNYFEGQIDPIVICKGNTFGELEEDYKKIKRIQLIKMDIGYFNANSYYRVYKLLKDQNIDAVCDFTGNFAGLILFSAKLAGIKKRIAFYRGSSNHFKETFFRLMYNRLMLFLVKKNATKILSNSKTAIEYFFPNRNSNDKRFKVIYNGIDNLMFENIIPFSKVDFNIPANSFVIGHTGRYNVAKNHQVILKIAEYICHKYNNIYFVLCGKDTDVFLNPIILSNPILKDKVKILGYRNDVKSILPVFDLFFFPSITEGQPNSLIEAMLFGLPIVASNITTIIETTPNELHTELLNPLDTKGFCERIEEYYLDESKRIKNNFRQWTQNRFDGKKLFNQFYEEL